MFLDKGPLISILTPSLNTGKYLTETIHSVSAQSYGNCEHIVIDGGSTDGTISALESLPQIKWKTRIEKAGTPIVQAYREAFEMSRGEYIIQCCISDGFLDKEWFKTCVDILEGDSDMALVYGLPQDMSEEGKLGRICYPEFLEDPPPNGVGFLPLWLATGFFFPEGNYCVRREIFDRCFPRDEPDDLFRTHPVLGFIYNFHAAGYLPVFVPKIANYGRHHGNSRQISRRPQEKVVEKLYYRMVREYGKAILNGSASHEFRNGHSDIIGQLDPGDRKKYKKAIFRYKYMYSRLLRTDLYTILKKIRQQYGVTGFLNLVFEKIRRIL